MTNDEIRMTKGLPLEGVPGAARRASGGAAARSSGFVIRHSTFRKSSAGYLLLELILALIIFTVAIVGLARSSRIGIQTVGSLSRENDVRLGLRSFLEEVRRKPLAEMEQSIADERLGLTFTSQVDELTLKNVSGTVLRDLYKLRVSAIVEGQAPEDAEAVEVWVYKPRTESR